jgi:hypothetical protein
MKSFQFKRTQRKYKSRYRIGNWAAYEAGLRQRGSVTIWITDDVKEAWCHRGRRKPGGKRIYSDAAIETFWALRMIYGLALRQTEGFIGSLFELAGVNLPVPDHTVVSRRVRKLGKVPMIPRGNEGPIHLLVDSSGLKIHVGNARKPPKRRAWRKIHLAVDRETGDIVAADLTASNARDAARVPALLRQIENDLASFCADGAYDKDSVYGAIEAHGVERRTRVIIPPQKGTLLSSETETALRDRNRHLRSINRVGRREWHLRSGFSRRSTVENVVYRYKTILGRHMKSRTLAGQRVEARIGGRILNRMAKLGIPQSNRAACCAS